MNSTFLLLMLPGTLFLGVEDFLKKKYLNNGMSEQVLLSTTFFLAGFLLMPILFIGGIPTIEPQFWNAFVGTVILNVVAQNLFIRAYKYNEASIIAPLRLITPILVIFTGFIVLREVPSFIGTIGIFTTLVGLYMLLYGKIASWGITNLKNNGLILGFLACLLFAFSFVLDKQAVVSSSALFMSSLVFMSIGLLTGVINLIVSPTFLLKTKETILLNWRSLLLISVLISIGAFLTNQSLNYTLTAYASSIKRLQVLWTVILAGIFLHESQIGRRTLAVVVMFFGVALTIWAG